MYAPLHRIARINGAGIAIVTVDIFVDAAQHGVAAILRARVIVVAIYGIVNAAIGLVIAGADRAGVIVVTLRDTGSVDTRFATRAYVPTRAAVSVVVGHVDALPVAE
jgi:hypothetical protein